MAGAGARRGAWWRRNECWRKGGMSRVGVKYGLVGVSGSIFDAGW